MPLGLGVMVAGSARSPPLLSTPITLRLLGTEQHMVETKLSRTTTTTPALLPVLLLRISQSLPCHRRTHWFARLIQSYGAVMLRECLRFRTNGVRMVPP